MRNLLLFYLLLHPIVLTAELRRDGAGSAAAYELLSSFPVMALTPADRQPAGGGICDGAGGEGAGGIPVMALAP